MYLTQERVYFMYVRDARTRSIMCYEIRHSKNKLGVSLKM
jgi:hypothetical protein